MSGVKKQVFAKIPGAVVEISGLSQLRKYLASKVTTWNGLKVLGFVSMWETMYVRVEYPDGTNAREVYGVTDDVAHNVQLGFYEGGVK